MSDFSTMTVAQLKSYADDNDIDLGDAKRKSEIIGIISGFTVKIEEQKIIGSDKIVTEKRIPKSATKADENGVMTTATADNFKDKAFSKSEPDDSKIAIHSEKNLYWNGVGSLKKGYNIVTKEVAEKWLTRRGIRQATPEEVASYYGL